MDIIKKNKYNDGIKLFNNPIKDIHKNEIYNTAIRANFKLGWEDTEVIERRAAIFLYSEWNDILDKIIPLFNYNDEIAKLIDKRYPYKCILNCSLFNDVFYKHTHSDSDVLLYYFDNRRCELWCNYHEQV